MTWTPGEIEITLIGRDPVKVCGWSAPSGLAVHPDCRLDAVGRWSLWTVTHIRTGMALAGAFSAQADAVDYAECVAGLAPWTRINAPWKPRTALKTALLDMEAAILYRGDA